MLFKVMSKSSPSDVVLYILTNKQLKFIRGLYITHYCITYVLKYVGNVIIAGLYIYYAYFKFYIFENKTQ